jgi:DNA primase
MTGRIAEEKIREIRERSDIVALVSSYLPLKRSGANHQGLCPFHGEKTPSFNVNATRQIFHCFGCGVGGNVFSFLMRMEGLTFPEAVRRLGERVGVEVEEEALTPAEERRRDELERLGRINEVACDFYHQLLLEGGDGESAGRASPGSLRPKGSIRSGHGNWD